LGKDIIKGKRDKEERRGGRPAVVREVFVPGAGYTRDYRGMIVILPGTNGWRQLLS
jgi:hypothetical protein